MEQKSSSIMEIWLWTRIIVLTSLIAFTSYHRLITRRSLNGLSEDVQYLQSLRLKKHSSPREANDNKSQTKGCAQDT